MMLTKISRPTGGFTIVELLIVIVVIAILASISMTTYAGVQQRASNTARISDVRKMRSLIQQYMAVNGADALVALAPTGNFFCLGEGYTDVDPGPGTSCYGYTEDPGDDYDSYDGSSLAINNALKEFGNYSISSLPPVRLLGSYVWGGTTYNTVDESSSPQLYFYRPPFQLIDGAPGFAHLWYMLEGSNVDCGVRPILRYVSGAWTTSSSAINSGYNSQTTNCMAYIPRG